MKKITLALCACAFALTGLLASCSNESTSVNYVDVGSHDTHYKYAVKGTITTTSLDSVKQKEVTDEYGFTSKVLDKNGKVTSHTTVTKETVTNGLIDVSYSTDENEESNYKDYSFDGYYTYTSTTTSDNTTLGDKDDYTKTSASGTRQLQLPSIKKIGDEYYFIRDAEAKKIEEFAISDEEAAFDGDFGEEFTLTLKFSDDYSDFESWLNYHSYGWTDVTDIYGAWYGKTTYKYSGKLEDTDAYKAWEKYKEAGYTNTSTTELKLTFYPLQEFDPEAEVEEDEE